MNYLTLFLTEQCNRKCEYCDIARIKKQKSINIFLINKFIPIIKESKWNNIVLTGGEPTLVKEDVLDYIINELGDKFLKVNTNGLWIKKGYFEKYYDKVDKIQLHPVSEINEFYDNIIDDKIIYHFPVHKRNIIYLRNFLKRNKDIKIRLAPYDEKYINNDFSLTTMDFIEIYDIIKNFKNITDDTKILFKNLSKNTNYNKLKECCFYPSIDFVNGRIKKCIKSHTLSDWFELTEENFNNMKNLKYTNNDICNNCHLFIRDYEKLIRMLICSD